MKELSVQSTNQVNIVGKLLSATFKEGTTKDGKPYESCTYTVRVNQPIEGHEEIDEIELSMFASKYTNAGKPHPGFKNIQDMKTWKTVQEYGEDKADTIRTTSGSLRENYFVSKSGQFIDGWRINTSFVSLGGKGELATFTVDIFIMDMHDEVDSEGDPTGRLIVKGGIVQYGGKLDVIEFVVEGNDAVSYIQRHWNANDTVQAKGRIRYTSKEIARPATESSWGEELPDVATTRMARELVITTGSDEGYDEDFAYDPIEIKKAFNVRKAEIEQAQVNATASKKAATPASGNVKYSWE